MAANVAQPVPFISFDEAKREFRVNPQAVTTLSKLGSTPVAVLAIAGRARQGKSWLLNQLLTKLQGPATGGSGLWSRGAQQQPEGFKVAPSVRPVTKGLWIWSTPIERKTPTGQKFNLVLVDCEGIDAFDQTLDYSTQVFSLGVLLSSLLIFNQLGSIDESSVDKLASVCEFAKLIRQRSGAAGERDFAELSPAFLWLLRDFHLSLIDEQGRKITPKDYMEEVLAPKGNDVAKNQMRASISSLFPTRDCFALVRPLNDEGQLASMDKVPLKDLRPEFRQGLDTLLATLLERAQPKTFKGQFITGSALATFAQAYAQVLNKGEVPALSSTWQSVLATENQHALDAALGVYRQQLEAGMAQGATTPGRGTAASGGASGAAVDKLDSIHSTALAAALATFRQQALGDASERVAYEAKLQAAAEQHFKPVKEARLAQADAQAVQLLATATSRLATPLSRDPPDLDAHERELQAILADYDKQAAGPSKFKRVAEFMVNTVVAGLTGALRKAQASLTAATRKAEAAAKEAQEAKAELARHQQQLGAEKHAVSVLKTQLAEAQGEAARAREAAARSQADTGREAARRETVEAEVKQLRLRIDTLTSQLTAAQTATNEVQARAAASASEAATKAAAAAEQARLVAQLRQELEGAKTAAQSSRQQADSRVHQLEADINRLKADAALQANARSSLEREVAGLREAAAGAAAERDAARAELQTAGQTAAQAAAHAARIAELTQQLAQVQAALQARETDVQRLQTERAFLQSQYDEQRRASLGAANGQAQRSGSFTFAPAASPATGAATGGRPSVLGRRAREEEEEGEGEGGEGGPAGMDTDAAGQPPDEEMDGEALEAGPSSAPRSKRQRVVRAKRGGAGGSTQAAGPAATPGQQDVPAAAADGGAPGASPFSAEKEVVMLGGRRGSAHGTPGGGAVTPGAGGAAGSGGSAARKHKLPEGLASMTIAQMKQWMTEAGEEQKVWDLSNRKSKKEDWVAAVKALCGAQ